MARRITASNRNGTEQSVMTDLTVVQAVALLRPVESNNFAQSLIRDYDKYRGDIGGNKSAWLMVMAQNHLDRRKQPAATAPTALTATFADLTALFTRALASGKKYPKIALRTAGGLPVVLSIAGERSRYAGSVQITDGGKYPDNIYYGRIEPSGAFAGRDPGPDAMDLLRRFAADPQGVAAAYGRETGECCFCQAELTDERSVLQGYGPICAERHGLPWGARPAASGVEQPQLPFPTDAEIERADRQRRDREHAAHFAALERQRERAGFASDPDYSGFRQTQVPVLAYDELLERERARDNARLSPTATALSYDELLERAAVVATRDGYLQPRAERLLVGAVANDTPWRDDD